MRIYGSVCAIGIPHLFSEFYQAFDFFEKEKRKNWNYGVV